MIGEQLVRVATTAAALEIAGVAGSKAWKRAAVANQDDRFAGIVLRRQVAIVAQLDDDPGLVLRRAIAAGLPLLNEDLPEVLAHVETVHELLGDPGAVEALGPVPMEHP